MWNIFSGNNTQKWAPGNSYNNIGSIQQRQKNIGKFSSQTKVDTKCCRCNKLFNSLICFYHKSCKQFVCIWCLYDFYQEYKNIRPSFQLIRITQDEFQLIKSSWCCRSLTLIDLKQFQQFLKITCAICGKNCKRSDTTKQKDFNLTGLKCYRNLIIKEPLLQSEKRILEKLSIYYQKTCSQCNFRKINQLVGRTCEVELKKCHLCQKNSRNLCCIKCKQTQYFAQSKKTEIIDFGSTIYIDIVPEIYFVPWQGENYYCYFCVYQKFQEMQKQMNKKRQDKNETIFDEIQFLQKKINFQEIFANHCICCGFNIQQISQIFVFPICRDQDDIIKFFCSTCQFNVLQNLTKLKSLKNLKFLLIDLGLYSESVNDKKKISAQQTKISQFKTSVKRKLEQFIKQKQYLLGESVISLDSQIMQPRKKKYESIIIDGMDEESIQTRTLYSLKNPKQQNICKKKESQKEKERIFDQFNTKHDQSPLKRYDKKYSVNQGKKPEQIQKSPDSPQTLSNKNKKSQKDSYSIQLNALIKSLSAQLLEDPLKSQFQLNKFLSQIYTKQQLEQYPNLIQDMKDLKQNNLQNTSLCRNCPKRQWLLNYGMLCQKCFVQYSTGKLQLSQQLRKQYSAKKAAEKKQLKEIRRMIMMEDEYQ